MKKLIIAALLLTTASQAVADQDTWGNKYPPECSKEALANVYLPVLYKPQAIIDLACNAKGRVGCYTKSTYTLILSGLDPEVEADVRRHEACHKKKGKWHPGEDGN